MIPGQSHESKWCRAVASMSGGGRWQPKESYDQFLAKALTKTEIMVLNLQQKAHLSQRLGQTLINTVNKLRHFTIQSWGFAEHYHRSPSPETWATLQGICNGWVQFIQQKAHLSQRLGQTLINTVNTLRHSQLRVRDLQSTTIVHLLSKVERPFRESSCRV